MYIMLAHDGILKCICVSVFNLYDLKTPPYISLYTEAWVAISSITKLWPVNQLCQKNYVHYLFDLVKYSILGHSKQILCFLSTFDTFACSPLFIPLAFQTTIANYSVLICEYYLYLYVYIDL